LANIDTLVPDIQALLTDGGARKLTSVPEFADKLARRIAFRVEETRGPPRLRLSNLGTPCERKLWYSINLPGMGEALSAEAELKFLYGDILEETVLWLAKAAGHSVEREQDEVSLYGVVGHIDAIVDGVLVDVKSASSFSFNRFAAGLSPDTDSFGYLVQLDAYMSALDRGSGGFLVVDKTLGKICLDKHPRSVVQYERIIDDKRRLLAQRVPPPRRYADLPDGQSGNRKLDTVCGYCAFKQACWPGLPTFLYAGAPRFLTKVVREPNVPEG